MYNCSICNKEVTVDHVNPPVFNCTCADAKVITTMSSHLAGKGGLNANAQTNNNLHETSALVIKQMMSIVLGIEFFQNNKEEIFAKDVVIEDSETKRRFEFNLTAKEL